MRQSTLAPDVATTLRYGMPGAVLALLGIPLFLLVPAYFVDELGFSAGAVGAVLLAARLLDVLVDPLAGHGCRSAGRARWTLAAGVPLLAGGAALLFFPPADAGLAWLFTGALAACLGWTLLAVPLYALGAVLPGDDAGRQRLAISREGFVMLGTLAALALPAAAGIADDLHASLALLGVLLLVLLPVAVFLLWPLLPRARWTGAEPWPALFAHSQGLFRAPAFRRLLAAYFLNALANAIPATLLVLYVTHVLQARADLGLFLVLYLASGLLALPAWLWLAQRLGAARAWWLSMGWAALVFAAVPAIGAGDTLAFALVCVATGLSVGADNALPAALQARVVATLRDASGRDDAGLAFGWWGVTTKLALALGAALGLGAIDAGGFDPATPTTPDGTRALVLAYAALPVVLKLAAVFVAWRAMRAAIVPVTVASGGVS